MGSPRVGSNPTGVAVPKRKGHLQDPKPRQRKATDKTMTPVGFEPTQLALVELESTPLDHSGKVSMNVVLFHHVWARWKLFSLSLRNIS